MNKRTDKRPLKLETQTLRTLTDKQLSLIGGGVCSFDASCEGGCEIRRR